MSSLTFRKKLEAGDFWLFTWCFSQSKIMFHFSLSDWCKPIFWRLATEKPFLSLWLVLLFNSSFTHLSFFPERLAWKPFGINCRLEKDKLATFWSLKSYLATFSISRERERERVVLSFNVLQYFTFQQLRNEFAGADFLILPSMFIGPHVTQKVAALF